MSIIINFTAVCTIISNVYLYITYNNKLFKCEIRVKLKRKRLRNTHFEYITVYERGIIRRIYVYYIGHRIDRVIYLLFFFLVFTSFRHVGAITV